MPAGRRPAARRIAILGHPERPEVRRAARRLAAGLARRGHVPRFDERLAAGMGAPGYDLNALGRWCSILVALGGDGTALRGARAIAGRSGVLLPVNHGGLGFLAVAEAHELDAAMTAALSGAWAVTRRRLLAAVVTRNGRRAARSLAMNDVVMKAAGGYAAVHFALRALGSDLGHLVADGLVVASAAGSTAYSLSAGGPVVAHDLAALVVSPVCAHSLGSRSLVLGDDDPVEVRVLGSFDRTRLHCDGQEAFDLLQGDQVSVRLSRTSVRVYVNPQRPLARALRSKLGWQGSERRSFGE